MKKLFIVAGLLVFVGVAWWLGSPLFISKTVNEGLDEIMATENEDALIISSGIFIGLAGHHGEGTARLIKSEEKHYVRFDEDFNVTNGPDLFVYLGKDGQYDPAAKLDSLKGNIGSQNYEIPAGINVSDYNEVWVWCRAFRVPFAKALVE